MPTPKQKYLQGLGGSSVSNAPINWNAINVTPVQQKPMLPGLGGTVSSNAGATSIAPPPITKPAQSTPQQQYTQNQTPNQNPNTNFQTNTGNAPQGTPTQVPKADPQASYRAAFDSYIQSLNPSSAETEAQKYLNDLVQNNKRQMLDIQNRPGQTTSFAGAEQERAGQNNALNIEAASNALDAFTKSRGAMTDAQKARLDFEQSLIPKSEDFTLGAGDVRYDAQGNKIAEGGVKPPTLPASAQEYEYAKSQGYKGSYDQYQTEDANRKRSIVNINAAGLTPTATNTALKLSDDYEQRSKDFYTQRDAYNRVVSSASDPSAAGDLALIFNYMKTLDPGSTVREGEFATAQNSGSAFDVVGAKYNKVMSGERLTQAQRNDFVKRAKTIFTGSQAQQDAVAKEFTARAAQYGIPANLVVRDTTATGSNNQSQNQTPQNSNPLEI